MMLMRDVARRLPDWEAPAKLSLALALLLFIVMLVLGLGGPQIVQLPARIGAFGLLITAQLIVLWGNRREISPYHKAQQHFIVGEYQAARSILEAIPESSRESVDALVLLGNCYRHLSLFGSSHASLARALQLKPQHHLALFSAGKLNLVCGEYTEARDTILQALDAGTPDIVHFELGQISFLLGDQDGSRMHFNHVRAEIAEQPAQLLLLQYYMFCQSEAERPSRSLIREGVDYWRNEANKFSGTSYGDHLQLACEKLDAWLKGD